MCTSSFSTTPKIFVLLAVFFVSLLAPFTTCQSVNPGYSPPEHCPNVWNTYIRPGPAGIVFLQKKIETQSFATHSLLADPVNYDFYFMAGSFRDSMEITGTRKVIRTKLGATWSYIARYRHDGKLAWHTVFESKDFNSITISKIMLDAQGYLVVVGTYFGVVTLGSEELPISSDKPDIFMIRMEAETGEILQQPKLEGLLLLQGEYITTSFALIGNDVVLALSCSSSERRQSETVLVLVKRNGKTSILNRITQPLAQYTYLHATLVAVHTGTRSIYVSGQTVLQGATARENGFLLKYTYTPTSDTNNPYTVTRDWFMKFTRADLSDTSQELTAVVSLAIMKTGDIVIGGVFEKSIRLNNQTAFYTVGTTRNAYIAKLAPTGTILYANGYDAYDITLDLDAKDNILAGGLNRTQSFLMKLAQQNGEVVWVKRTRLITSSQTYVYTKDIEVDTQGFIYSLNGILSGAAKIDDLTIRTENDKPFLFVIKMKENCTCEDPLCQIPLCNGRLNTDPQVCSQNGLCVGPNLCDCFAGYTGDYCQVPLCQGDCSGKGKCVAPNTCQCDAGYKGLFCESPTCFGIASTEITQCSGAGICVAPDRCMCHFNITIGDMVTSAECTVQASTKYVSQEDEYRELPVALIFDGKFVNAALQSARPLGEIDLDFILSAEDLYKFDIHNATDQSYIIAGYMSNFPEQDVNIYLARITSDFGIIWYKTSDRNEKGLDVVVRTTPKGTFIFACGFYQDYSAETEQGKIGAFISKMLLSGEEIWRIESNIRFAYPNTEVACVATSITYDEVTGNLIVFGDFEGSINIDDCELVSGSRSLFMLILSVDGKCLIGKVYTNAKDPRVIMTQQHRVFSTWALVNNNRKDIVTGGFRMNTFSVPTASSEEYFYWSEVPKPLTNDSIVRCTNIAIDSAGFIIVVGYFSKGVQFAEGYTLFSNDTDGFVAKYHINGFPVFIHQIGGLYMDKVRTVNTDSEGGIYIAGQCNGEARLNRNEIICDQYDNQSNAFFAKFNYKGQLVWHFTPKLSENSTAIGLDIVNSDADLVLAIGGFEGTISFGDTTMNSTEGRLFALTIQDDAIKADLKLVWKIILGICLGVVLFVIFMGAMLLTCGGYYTIYKKRVRTLKKKAALDGSHLERLLNGGDASSSMRFVDTELKPFFSIDQSMFELSFSELKDLEEIGSGGSGSVVYSAKWHSQMVAVKIFRTSFLSDLRHFEEFNNEVRLLASLRNNNIVNFLGAVLENPRVAIVTEFCEKGTLTKVLLTSKGKLPWNRKIGMMIDIANGMCFLHSKRIIHRDLKSENILVDKNFVCKVSDFGLSKMKEHNKNTMTKFVGTSSYMAPEVTLGKEYDEKCDVFSFGIIMFEIVVETTEPYGSDVGFNVELQVAQNAKFRPRIPPEMNFLTTEQEASVKLMEKCWQHEAKARPSFLELIEELEALRISE